MRLVEMALGTLRGTAHPLSSPERRGVNGTPSFLVARVQGDRSLGEPIQYYAW
jgi:hypothetical protein